jgi:hypothetical protein
VERRDRRDESSERLSERAGAGGAHVPVARKTAVAEVVASLSVAFDAEQASGTTDDGHRSRATVPIAGTVAGFTT